MPVVEANGIAHHYDDRGTGPIVLLLHGGMESSESWDAQTPALAAAHRVVAIDRRGHGRTPDADGPITYEAMRDDTVACIEALDLGGAHLVGWSDGGIVALMVAIARPELVGRVVTLGANASDDAYTAEARDVLGADSPLIDLMRDDYVKLSPDGPRHWPVVRDKVLQLWWSDPLDLRADISRIEAPTLVMAGDDDCIEPAHLLDLFRRLPKGRLGIVPGASHVAPMEQPDLVNAMILDFLDGPDPPPELLPLLPRRNERPELTRARNLGENGRRDRA